METSQIIIFFILLALNIVISLLSKTKYRSEDAERIADGSVKVLCYTKGLWRLWILMVIPMFPVETVRNLVFLIFVVVITFVGFIDVLCYYNSYFTIDDERLTYIKHGKLKWSCRWDEIDYARSYATSEKEGSAYYYDIIRKDGVKYRFLPLMLKESLEQHVRIQKHVWEWIFLLYLIPFVAFILLVLWRILED